MFELVIRVEKLEGVFMSTSDEIVYLDIDNRDSLLPYYESISRLFSECFGKGLDRKLWDWAYIDNPSGEPLVSIAVCNGNVIGHYAVIPMPLENADHKIQGYLSMTTMVSSAFRRHSLFQILANRVFERIGATDKPAVVFGFPNDNSAPGFRKRLGWTISEDYKVVEMPKQALINYESFFDQDRMRGLYTLNLNDHALFKWRTSKPSQEWSITEGMGIKYSGDFVDVMYVDKPELLSNLRIDQKFNIILPVGGSCSLESGKISFPYRFGYRFFNCESIEDKGFFVQMCMSDVF